MAGQNVLLWTARRGISTLLFVLSWMVLFGAAQAGNLLVPPLALALSAMLFLRLRKRALFALCNAALMVVLSGLAIEAQDGGLAGVALMWCLMVVAGAWDQLKGRLDQKAWLAIAAYVFFSLLVFFGLQTLGFLDGHFSAWGTGPALGLFFVVGLLGAAAFVAAYAVHPVLVISNSFRRLAGLLQVAVAVVALLGWWSSRVSS